MSCAAPRNSAPSRKYVSDTPISVNSSQTAARTMFRDNTTPSAETAVMAATIANRMTESDIGRGGSGSGTRRVRLGYKKMGESASASLDLGEAELAILHLAAVGFQADAA